MKLSSFLLTLKGGPGSGNHGHAGIPGHVGGSTSSGGKSSTSVGQKYDKVSDAEMREIYDTYHKDCRSPDCLTTSKYTMDSDDFNLTLRSGGSAGDHVLSVDKYINEGPRVPKNIVVHRSVTDDFFSSGVFEKGSEFQDKGFISTTIKKGSIGGENLEIRVPKGAKGLYVQHISASPGDNEFLLPRNSKFRVVQKTDKKAILELIVE